MKKICVVTGTRAEYGLLKPLMHRIQDDDKFELQLIVTGMHLSPEFGLTYKQIEEDGFKINEKIEILLSSDSIIGTSKSMGLALISFSECFQKVNPDMVILLGDRYEIFAAAAAASVAKIPIGHLHGGETTEGAFDEAFRHSITKMSYLHFTSTECYRKRVIQLGEMPERVFNVGAIGIENIKHLKLMTKDELEDSINFKLGNEFALVTFHPVTLESNTSEQQIKNLLEALNKFKHLKVIFTKANSDTEGRIINKLIDDYTQENSDRVVTFTSMGVLRYLSAMKYCSMVLGNSSSGIIEAPSFNVPTVNIGDRQKGRLQADSIVNCKPTSEDIEKSIQLVLTDKFKEKIRSVINPYGDGTTSEKIVEKIKEFLFYDRINLKKKFYDCEVE